MPIPSVESKPIDSPETPYNAIRYSLFVQTVINNGVLTAPTRIVLNRCRVLANDVWEDDPTTPSKAVQIEDLFATAVQYAQNGDNSVADALAAVNLAVYSINQTQGIL